MNKILITVLVPMIEEKYDMYIPVSKKISTIIELIAKTINELSLGHFPVKDKYTLMNLKGVPYSESLNVKESGLRNADTVIFI